MHLKIKRTEKLKGTVELPASKSYSIRAFIIGACGGESQIIKPSRCDDAMVAMRVARALGCQIERKKDTWYLKAFKGSSRLQTISVGESGTVLRLLLPLLPAHVSKAVVSAEGTLIGRPNTHLLQTLRQQGLKISGTGDNESVPIRYQGGDLKAGHMTIDGSLSSQFVSALLIATARLSESSKIEIKGSKIVSRDYIAMTIQVLNLAGVRIKESGGRVFGVQGHQLFKGLKDFIIPSDYGLAAFLMAAGSLVDSDIHLKGSFNDRFIQADGRIMGFLKKMGVKLKRTSSEIHLKGPFVLKGGLYSLRDCPDLVPIMAVLALFARERTILKDIQHARVKESDRISDLRRELLKVGAQVSEKTDALIIDPLRNPRMDVVLDSHHDHRLAMAFAVLGLKLGVTVEGIECCAKSYPDFVRDFKSIGAVHSVAHKN